VVGNIQLLRIMNLYQLVLLLLTYKTVIVDFTPTGVT
jgi:hypothetical protein